MTDRPLVEVSGLVTAFDTESGRVTAVDGIDFSVDRGGTLGIVGESGCGKSVTALSLMRLLPKPAGQVVSGSVMFDGRDLLKLPLREMERVRGGEIGMVFQEPMTALNPAHRIGKQLSEVLLLHEKLSQKSAWGRSIEMLERVGIPSPGQRITAYPHQLSGGMRQRVVIAMALACRPKLLIADEPTTALDVTIQAQILTLIKGLQAEMGMAVILITHDLGVIAETCDEVAVMYAGRIVERASVDEIFHRPRHLYTVGLLRSIPRMDGKRKTRLPAIEGMVPNLQDLPVGARFAPRSPHPDAPAYVASDEYRSVRPGLVEVSAGHWVEDHRVVRVADAFDVRAADTADDVAKASEASVAPELSTVAAVGPPILRVRELKKHFPVRSGVLLRQVGSLKAVDGVDLTLFPGETLGLVGESGCGKSTLAKTIVRLLDATAGEIVFDGTDISKLGGRALKPIRRDIQMIFQDPAESLNPRLTVGEILEEPFKIHRIADGPERKRRVGELLRKVGLQAEAAGRYPFEFSGGQRQRIGIARAIALEPKVIVCDEPVSALDVSVQSQILNLLMDLQREMGLAYVFIAHDLSVVKHISDRIAIMYLGQIVETGGAEEIYRSPNHPYTRALISAIPVADPRHHAASEVLTGDVPSPLDPPSGCLFSTRCPFVQDRCRAERPVLRSAPGDEAAERSVACHFDLFGAGVRPSETAGQVEAPV